MDVRGVAEGLEMQCGFLQSSGCTEYGGCGEAWQIKVVWASGVWMIEYQPVERWRWQGRDVRSGIGRLEKSVDDMKVLGLHPEWAVFRDVWRDFIWANVQPKWRFQNKWWWWSIRQRGITRLHIYSSSCFCLQFVQRVMIMFMPSKYQPDYMFLRNVPVRRVHLFTFIQMMCFGGLWAIKQIQSISIIFPLMVGWWSLPLLYETRPDPDTDWFFKIFNWFFSQWLSTKFIIVVITIPHCSVVPCKIQDFLLLQ